MWLKKPQFMTRDLHFVCTEVVLERSFEYRLLLKVKKKGKGQLATIDLSGLGVRIVFN